MTDQQWNDLNETAIVDYRQTDITIAQWDFFFN